MVTTPRSYKFVGAPAAARNNRIPRETWERYKDEAIEIYRASNVGEVRLQMRLRHGFEATERQYTYNLTSLWGVRKQGTGATESPEAHTAASCEQRILKRRRSTTSIDAHGMGSTDSGPVKPPRKKTLVGYSSEHHEDTETSSQMPHKLSATGTPDRDQDLNELSPRVSGPAGADSIRQNTPEPSLRTPVHDGMKALVITTHINADKSANEELDRGDGEAMSPHTSESYPFVEGSSQRGATGVPTMASPTQAKTPPPCSAPETTAATIKWLHPSSSSTARLDSNDLIKRPNQSFPPSSIKDILDAVDAGADEAFGAYDNDYRESTCHDPLLGATTGMQPPARRSSPSVVSMPNERTCPTPCAGNRDSTPRQYSSEPPTEKEGVGLRIIDRNSPVDTFSDEDMADIRRAADFFSMLHCDQEAFELYTTMLKRQQSTAQKYPDPSIDYLVIQCASTASNRDHVEIIQNIIHENLSNFNLFLAEDSSTRLAKFVLYMLLALISNRNADLKGAQANLSNAADYVPRQLDKLFEGVLPDDKSFCLPLYLNVMRLATSELSSLTSPMTYGLSDNSQRAAHIEDYVLHHMPWSFTHYGHPVPCVRSCVAWCNKRLFGVTWRSTQAGEKVAGLYGDSNTAWAERDTLFIKLWGDWKSTGNCEYQAAWIVGTQTSMGISPTEMLMVVCRMIYDYHDSHCIIQPRTEQEFIHLMRTRTECMLGETDEQLGKRFLQQYIARNTVSLRPESHNETRKLNRHHAIACLEHTLGVHFVDIGTHSAERRRSTRHLRAPVRPQEGLYYSPTLASSISSFDLTEFKKTGAKAARRLSRFARGSLSISSTLSRYTSGTKVSNMARMSDLSSSLNSMIISEETSATSNGAPSQISSQMHQTGGMSLYKFKELEENLIRVGWLRSKM